MAISPKKNEIESQSKSQRVKNHRSEYARQAWSKMTECCAGWVEEAKTRYLKRGWSKRGKNREIGNKID